MNKLLATLIVLALAGPARADTNTGAFNAYGLWLTQAKDAHVEITDCGDGTPCGALVWVEPETAVSDYDIRNDDPQLRGRTLIGVPIVWGYSRGQKDWRGGYIYNPEYGETYKSSMRLQKDGRLKVKGCLGPLCITNIWTRVETRTTEK